MATKEFNASLSSDFIISPVTGFIDYKQGQLDIQTSAIKPLSSSSWSMLSGSSWSNFNNFTIQSQQIRWTSPLVDLGSSKYFTLDVRSEFSGSLYYLVHTSETGAFAGEESETLIEEGDDAIEAFYGQFVYVTAFVNGSELRKMTIKTSSQSIEVKINNLDTSTLSGTSSARLLELPQDVSKITDIKVECQAPTAYAVNLYVSDTATSQVLIPIVKNKSIAAPTIALYGIDNDARDGVVDVTISALPKQVMYSGNIYTIS
jgi:hypothetical protein